MCNECGLAFLSLQDLQVVFLVCIFPAIVDNTFNQIHLQRKTAWSNKSLLGCRISCLIDNKEWHEGVVTHFHRSGKHSVEFRAIGEKRWLNMMKMAFYIIEQGPSEPTIGSNEYKENDDGDASAYVGIEVRVDSA